tara:strand:+ start:296 stop:547 length:252 start_codon:yes stop_codon:yes gene_type:complete
MKILNEIRNQRTGFKIILGYIILNLMVLTFWDEWGSYERFSFFDLGLEGGSMNIEFNDKTFWIGILCLLIYWLLWGHKKKEKK